MIELKEKHCVPCEEGTKPFTNEQIIKIKSKLPSDWKVIDNKSIRKEFQFENFERGMAFAQEIALVAEKEKHHPDICIHYSKVDVELSSHAIGGLSENDFIMAAKVEQL